MLFIRKAMLRPKVRIVCKPSLSSSTSSGLPPYTMFQYWLLTIGIPFMVKYLLSISKVAVFPPRRQETTAAPTFMVLSVFSVLKNSRSRKDTTPPAGEAKYTGEPMTKASASANFGATSFTISSNTHFPLPVEWHLRQAMQPRTSLFPTWMISVSMPSASSVFASSVRAV